MNYSTTKVLVLVAIQSLFTLVLFAQDKYPAPVVKYELISFIEKSNSNTSTINKIDLGVILIDQPEKISTLLLDRKGKKIEVTLSKSNLGKNAPKSTLYYHGNINSEKSSLVALKISEKGIKAMISDKEGNYQLTTEGSQVKTSTKKSDQKNTEWSCQSDLLYDQSKATFKSSNLKSAASDTLSIYFVCDYSLYQTFGSSRSLTLSYVYDMFHQVQSIYNLENIQIVISDVFIWESSDPYDNTSSQNALLSFRNIIGDTFGADFAHLLSANSSINGGIAFINGLCNSDNAYAYSNVNGAIDILGNYSWDVHVVAHEIGHNMGSPHTHDCAWGPNGDVAIDACGGPPPSCDDAPIPEIGGTIMSYCHQTNVGVNFSLGFGPEPGNLIRQTINLCKPDEGESCDLASVIVENGSYITGSITSGSGASHAESNHAKWYSFHAPESGTLTIRSCDQGIDTRLFVYEGVCNNFSELGQSDDDCLSGGGYFYASELNNMPVDSNDNIYIEWDDKWSSDSFQFSFEFNANRNSCDNGVQDGNETGIDCGGSCAPCMEPCSGANQIPAIIDTNYTYKRMQEVSYDGQIIMPGNLEISSGQGAIITEGFAILAGAEFEISIGDCKE